MSSKLKRKLVIGVTTVAAAAFAGGAYAATQNSGATSRQAFLNDVAKRLHVTPAQLSSALKGAELDQLSAAVASGKLTQAQANVLKQQIEKAGAPLPGVFGFGPPGLLLAPRPFGPEGLGPAGKLPVPGPLRRFALPGPPGRFALPGPPGAPVPVLHGHGMLSAAASYLGIGALKLLDQLSAGKSLAQLAKAQSKSVSGLKAAITAAIKARLDKAVAAKFLTSAQEQAILSHLTAGLDGLINRSMPGFGPRLPGTGLQWRMIPNGDGPGPAVAVPARPAGPAA